MKIRLLSRGLTGSGIVHIPSGWSLGPVSLSATTSGAGSLHIHDGMTINDPIIVVVRSAQYVGGTVGYPIASGHDIFYNIAGTAALGDIWINQ